MSEEKAVEKIKEADLDGDGRVASSSSHSLLVFDGGVESLMELGHGGDVSRILCTVSLC